MGILQQPYASLRDLETLGMASDRIQAIPILNRRVGLKAGSGRLEPYLRKRFAPDFVVQLDDDFTDASGMTGGAAISSLVMGPTLRVMDVAVQFPAGGTVGATGITFQLNTEDGATGSVYGAAAALPTSGIFALQGYTFTVQAGAVINAGDVYRFSLRTDAGLSLACAQITAWVLLGSGGIDPKSLETLKDAADLALDWAKDIGTGDGELAKGADATPTKNEGGIRFPHGRAQVDAYAWARADGERRRGDRDGDG